MYKNCTFDLPCITSGKLAKNVEYTPVLLIVHIISFEVIHCRIDRLFQQDLRIFKLLRGSHFQRNENINHCISLTKRHQFTRIKKDSSFLHARNTSFEVIFSQINPFFQQDQRFFKLLRHSHFQTNEKINHCISLAISHQFTRNKKELYFSSCTEYIFEPRKHANYLSNTKYSTVTSTQKAPHIYPCC